MRSAGMARRFRRIIDRVGTEPARKRVGAGVADEAVVARTAVKRIAGRRAVQYVVAVGAGDVECVGRGGEGLEEDAERYIAVDRVAGIIECAGGIAYRHGGSQRIDE